MKRSTCVGLWILAGTLAFSACESADDTTFAGAYSGDGVDSQSSSNRKEFTLHVADLGTAVTGTYQIKAILVDTSGSVAGTLNGSALELVLTPAAGVNDCPYRVTGTWHGNRITGSYAAFNCFVRSDGTLSLEKR